MIRLEVPDEDHALAAVRLVSDLPLADPDRTFDRRDDRWVLELPDLALHRLEYLLEVEHADGDAATAPDPVNDDRAPGAFGEKSVWTADDYTAPWWLEPGREVAPFEHRDLAVRSRALRATVDVTLWAPEGTGDDEELPLLVAHDGPEYDALSALTRYVGVLVADSELPRCRVALLAPGERDEWYSASGPYARALCTEVLPAVRGQVGVRGAPVGMGASLGGLAMLHALRRHPDAFAALFVQSASCFMPEHDEHERDFPRYDRIVRFSRALERARAAETPVEIVMTCGTEEENIHNNRRTYVALARQGHGAALVELGDLHNYTAWRDAFDPHLTDLLVRAWGPRR